MKQSRSVDIKPENNLINGIVQETRNINGLTNNFYQRNLKKFRLNHKFSF